MAGRVKAFVRRKLIDFPPTNWLMAEPWRVYPLFSTGWRYSEIWRMIRSYPTARKHPLYCVWHTITWPHVHHDDD